MKIIENWIEQNKKIKITIAERILTPEELIGGDLKIKKEEYVIACDKNNIAIIMIACKMEELKNVKKYLNTIYDCTIFYKWNKKMNKWRII